MFNGLRSPAHVYELGIHLSRPIQGYVDRISTDRCTIVGWVETDHIQHPELTVVSSPPVAGTVRYGKERQSVTAARGVSNVSYQIALDRPLNPFEIISGSATANAAGKKLPISMALQTSERSEALLILQGEDGSIPTDTLRMRAEASNRTASRGELTAINFPVGMDSHDRTSQLGRDGQMFLIRGSNSLIDLYQGDATTSGAENLEYIANAWVSLVRTRYEKINGTGAHFAQILLPEKLTALRHLAPVRVDGPTPLFKRVDALLSDEFYYAKGLEIFEAWDNRISPWQRNDSHTSPAGALAIARAILDVLPGCDSSLLDGVQLSRSIFYDGDLARRFFGIPIWDEHLEPDDARLDLAGKSVGLIHSHLPEKGFKGTRRVWSNPGAFFDKKIVVFGSSSFGRGGDMPAKLSWWFSRLFSEFHFIWDGDVDYAYVDSVEPDYVLCQSVERFLNKLPSS